MLHLAQGLQHDLGVPAVAVGLGHARHGEEHLAVEREIGAVAGSRKAASSSTFRARSVPLVWKCRER